MSDYESKDPGDVDFSKEFDLDLNYEIEYDVEFWKDVDVDVEFSVEACVEGNTAIIIFDAQAYGDDTYTEANVFTLTNDDMSSSSGSLMSVTG